MECNKEEAVRAKQIAEDKMQNGDYLGAQKLARKAQQLFPELDNVSQMLTVCDVHTSAQKTILGSEMDWYGILQVDQSADEMTIKKQYRKLALLLHPDKNKFSGAEAAFKLLGEAHRVLSDQAKRSVYDIKYRATTRTSVPRPRTYQSQRNDFFGKQFGGTSNLPNGPHPQYGGANAVPKAPYSQFTGSPSLQNAHDTFWTCCSSCGIKFQYYRNFVNRVLRCQSCKQSFTAYDLGTQGVPPGYTWSQFPNRNGPNAGVHNGFPNPGPSKMASQSNGKRPSGVKVSDKSARLHPVSTAGNTAQVDEGSKTQRKINEFMVGKEGVGVTKSNVANGKEGVGMPKRNVGKPIESGISTSSSKKRKRKSADGSSERCEVGSSDEEQNTQVKKNGGNLFGQNSGPGISQPVRRSSRQKQGVSYKENMHDDDDFVSPSKRSKESKPCNFSGEVVKEAGVLGGISEENKSASSADEHKRELKQNATFSVDENLLNKKSKTGEGKAMRKEADIANHDERKNDDISKLMAMNPSILEYPDADFTDFDKDKAESCFAVNQVWAIYDTWDGMPRFYAWIKKVFSPGFKLRITWLEPDPDDENDVVWCDADLPVACGKFMKGKSEETEDRLMFSHKINLMKGSGRTYLIYPKVGETWAIFRDWDSKWSSDPEKHKPPYQFDFVEILADFKENTGIMVAYLGKVKGFVSLFQQTAQDGVLSFLVASHELYRFSHRIPSAKMTGTERQGVPLGSFELDPASLPTDLHKRNYPGDVKTENKNPETEANGSCPKSPEDKVQCMTTQQKGNTSCPTGEAIKTPKKHKEDFATNTLNVRRSPRDLSKKSNQANKNLCTTQEDLNKLSDTRKDERHGNIAQSIGNASLSQSDEKMHSHVGDESSASVMGISNAFMGQKIDESQFHDFKAEKSDDKFQVDQVWALYSDRDRMPKTYAQVKMIESTPNFRLHVALLEACSAPKDASQPVCCGFFKVKNGKLNILPSSYFSHRLKALSIGRNRFEIHPRKGEVWAVYKNWNSESRYSDQDKGECDIVEVLENHEQSTKVVVLLRVNGSESLYRVPRSQRSKTGFMEIPRAGFARFSHQIPAYQLSGKEDGQFGGCWKLDPSAIPGVVICVD